MDAAEPIVELNFILRREQDGSYRADLRLRRPAGATTYDLALARPVALDPAALRAALPALDDYGRALAAQLFADGELRAGWERAATVAATLRLPLQVRLDLDPQDEGLHSLIWEALIPPGAASPLALSERVRLSRYLGTPNLAAGAPPADATPRALIAVADPTDLADFGLQPVGAVAEATRLRQALGAAPTTVLAAGVAGRATLAQLRAALAAERPAICILVCHGTLVGDEPFLWLERDDGAADQVAGSALVALLEELGVYPQLLVLGSCRSGGDGERVLPALAPRLVRAGVPAVIGAQGNVGVDAVAAALPALLAELRRDGVVDRALAAARFALRGSPDWWRPALWMHLPDGRLWLPPGHGEGARPAPGPEPPDGPLLCTHLRVTFVWAQSFDGPPRGGEPGGLVRLARRSDYVALFDDVKAAGGIALPDGTALALPWPRSRRQNFWLTYLESRPLSQIRGGGAYKHLVPLQAALPWQLSVAGLSGSAELAGFCFPHGVACALTIDCYDPMGRDELALLAPLLRRARLLGAPGSGLPEAAGAQEIAERALDRLAAISRGDEAPRQWTDLEPFSVATIVQGSGAHPALPVLEGGPDHRLLEALTRWQLAPQGAVPTPLAAARIPTGTPDAQAGDLLYGHRRARAVWLPRRFISTQPLSALSCYHHNLVSCALQVESLGGLVRQAAERLEAGLRLSGAQRTLAQRAYGALTRLHSGGRTSTYRTLSSKRHLEDNGLIGPLNRVRREFGQGALGEPGPGAASGERSG